MPTTTGNRKAYHKKYNAEHRTERRVLEKKYYDSGRRETKLAANKKWRDDHVEERKVYMKEYHSSNRADAKRQVLDALGDHCACCGFRDVDFLTVDHINRNGKEHRKNRGSSMWRAVVKVGCPASEYRILCWACNGNAGRTSNNECTCGKNRSAYGIE